MTTQTMDQTLNCCDCKQGFLFTARDQDFFLQQGYTPPRRCKGCRDQKKARQNDGSARGNQVSRPVSQRTIMSSTVVQYKEREAEASKAPAVQKIFARSFGPDAAPANNSSGRDSARGKKEEDRRRDAYGERRQRKNVRNWESDED